MNVGSIDLRAMLEFRPQEGRLVIGSDRMLLMRQAAFGILRSLLYERMGREMTHSLLSQFGYRCGQGDYDMLMNLFDWDSDMDRIAAGPVIHSWEGIVSAAPEQLGFDRAQGACHMFGTWVNSYEAELHREHIGKSSTPVCYTLAGYASGYASAFMNRPVVCVETQCIAADADVCRWEIRPAHEWDDRVLPYQKALDSTSSTIQKELEHSLAHLSTPLLRVWDGILAVPLIGTIDIGRAEAIMNTLLGEVARTSAQFVILDVTGVESVDDATANGIVRLASAVKLLGGACYLSGLRADVARTLASIQFDTGQLQTFATLKQALQHCLRELGHRGASSRHALR